MITDSGKQLVARYLAGISENFAEAIGIGIGSTSPSASDSQLDFEIEKFNISVRHIGANNRLIFKCSIPSEMQGEIYEVGLFSYNKNPASGVFSGENLAFFVASEGWTSKSGDVNSSFSNSNSRFGGQTIAQQQGSEFVLNRNFNLSGYSTQDTFKVSGTLASTFTPINISAYSVSSGVATVTVSSHPFSAGDNIVISGSSLTGIDGVHSVTEITPTTIKFNTTRSNSSGSLSNTTVSSHYQINVVFKSAQKSILYTVDIDNVGSYLIEEFAKSDNAAYVDFDWASIESVHIFMTGIDGTFFWDALRILDSDVAGPDLVLIGRITPNTPITKIAGVELELQYEMDLLVDED